MHVAHSIVYQTVHAFIALINCREFIDNYRNQHCSSGNISEVRGNIMLQHTSLCYSYHLKYGFNVS